jgi:CSLREA domain-containing protein
VSAMMQGMTLPKAMWARRARPLVLCVLAMSIAASIGLLVGADPALAKTFRVNSMEDAPDNSSTDDECATDFFQPGTEPNCTLRAAIQEANVNGESDTIVFDPTLSGTITLTLGRLRIFDSTPRPTTWTF